MTGAGALERRTVSRKTPGDGKLEITKRTAARLESLGTALRVDLDGQPVSARLGSAPCTCRGAEHPHVHYFLQADAFQQLVPGAEIDLMLDSSAGRLRLAIAAS